MSGEYRPIPFRWILPIAQLLVCLAILWPARIHLSRSVRTAVDAYRSRGAPLRESPVYLHDLFPDLPADFTDDQLNAAIVALARQPTTDTVRLLAPAMINLPALTVELPYSIFSKDKEEWTPDGMQFEEWRALSWPLVGIALWWLAGRGVEALIGAFNQVVEPKITYAEVGVAAIFVLLGGVILTMQLLDPVRAEDQVPGALFILAGALWTSLGTATIVARVMQWRIRRRSAAASTGGAIPA